MKLQVEPQWKRSRWKIKGEPWKSEVRSRVISKRKIIAIRSSGWNITKKWINSTPNGKCEKRAKEKYEKCETFNYACIKMVRCIDISIIMTKSNLILNIFLLMIHELMVLKEILICFSCFKNSTFFNNFLSVN